MGTLVARVRSIAEPLVRDEALELVDVEQKGSGPAQLLRVLVDRPGGVDLAACERVSRRLDAALEDVEELQDRYRLEVSSPGVHRPLQGRRAFERVRGRRIQVVRRLDGGRTEQVLGVLQDVDDERLVLRDDARKGGTTAIPHGEVATAKQALPW